jgi:hypothetical protein
MITIEITVRYNCRSKTGSKTEVGNVDKYYTVNERLIKKYIK